MKKFSLVFCAAVVMILAMIQPEHTQAATKYDGINVYIVGDSIMAGTGNMASYKTATKKEEESGKYYAGFGHYLNKTNLDTKDSAQKKTYTTVNNNKITVKFDESKGGSLVCGTAKGMIAKQVKNLKTKLKSDLKSIKKKNKNYKTVILMDGGANDALKHTVYCLTKLEKNNKIEVTRHVNVVKSYINAMLKIDPNASIVYILPDHIKNDNLKNFNSTLKSTISKDSNLKNKVTFISTKSYISSSDIQKDSLHITEKGYLKLTKAITSLPCMQIKQ